MDQLGFSDLTLKIGSVVKVFTMLTDGGTIISGGVYYVWSVFS